MITASGAVEYAFEGGELAESGDPAPSVFTTAMVRGLTTGEADRDQDGYVDLDEFYDYVYDAVRDVTPHQTPGKWTFGVQGDLVIARRNTPVTEPTALPPELQHSIESPLAGVRAGTVAELARLLSGRHQGLALAARQALETLAGDDSRTVVAAASAALGASTETVPEGPTGATSAIGPTDTPEATAPADGPPTAMTQRPPTARTTTRSRMRWWPATVRGRVILASLAAGLLLVGGLVTWRVLDHAAHSTTTPASFAGEWKGTNVDEGAFTATLTEELQSGELFNATFGCGSGNLTVRDATDSQLTMRFKPDYAEAGGCGQWTVVFTHLSHGALSMKVDPDDADRPAFEVKMSRQE